MNEPLLDDEYDDPPEADASPIDTSDRVEALAEADRHLRKIAALRARRAEVVAVFDRELDRVKRRRQTLLDRLDRAIAWHEQPVLGFHEWLLTRDPKLKTVSLPHGDLKATVPQKPVPVVTDEAAFVAWALGNGLSELVRRPDPEVELRKVASYVGGEFVPEEPIEEVEVEVPVVWRIEIVGTDDDGPRLVPVPGLALVKRGARFRAVTPTGEDEDDDHLTP